MDVLEAMNDEEQLRIGKDKLRPDGAKINEGSRVRTNTKRSSAVARRIVAACGGGKVSREVDLRLYYTSSTTRSVAQTKTVQICMTMQSIS
jgi:hypothetical protein